MTRGREEAVVIDGDPETAISLRQLIGEGPVQVFNQILRLQEEVWTFDLVLETPINRILFFPRQSGVDKRGIPNKQGSPRAYRLSIQNEAEEFLLEGSEPIPKRTLATLIEETKSNTKSRVDVSFPPQPARFIRLDLSLADQFYSMAEFQVYGEGVPTKVNYVSTAIPLDEPVNFGEITYFFRSLRRDREADVLVEDPEGDARLLIETRSGTDDTPLAYYVVDDFGRDKEATESEWQRASLPRRESLSVRYPNQRSVVLDDETNWSPWSSPYRSSGQLNRSPDGRQYLQFRATFLTDDVLSIGRLDSLQFEVSPLLASSLVGEVSLADAAPTDQKTEVQPVEFPIGERRQLYFDIAADFSSDSQGFDAVRLTVPFGTRFDGLKMGDADLVAVAPDSVWPGDGIAINGELFISFASNRVSRDNDIPVRIDLESSLFTSSTIFAGEVIDSASANLPQSVDGGDARDDVHTNSLQVFSRDARTTVLDGVRLMQPALTPNGDRVNDEIHVEFSVLFVDEADVTVKVYDVAGRYIAILAAENRGRSAQDDRNLVPPGLYLLQIEVNTQKEIAQQLLTVPVVY
ncbi:MAG: T9SS type A sorting domain-containing protein [Candidatus Latescibacteria bacterium]|nr:T9SS type A sorting domain-containing protein [Candidatus Latescibacterota bacterium]